MNLSEKEREDKACFAARNNAYIDLSNIAYATVLKVLTTNDEKHGTVWLNKSIQEHLIHANEHCECLLAGDPPNGEDHLTHALTRIAMAIQVREIERKKSDGLI